MQEEVAETAHDPEAPVNIRGRTLLAVRSCYRQ